MSTNSEIKTRTAANRDCAAVRDLVFGVLAEYGLEPDTDGIDRDLFDIEEHYLNRGGVFEILEDKKGNIVGTVGLYPVDEKTIELRKMYFDKSIRGQGLGKEMLRKMIETSRRLGYEKLFLETASPLVEAIGLYKSFGFKPVDGIHAPRCDQAFYLELASD